ncbi:MAG: hypothetical protein RMY64_01705 [Nostoc sp. DedQUE08]|uniref:hypothetical protein n=1 Tax=Nostoc sp. DedQUE08 TaxID=3075393 RepID=UPI002AD4D954|nr:hypothetical protein [Nostoc sp. DedQUE08]MDZ8064343.1 hypothetical protein [Nostoc sp. DedQUE08]
MSKLHLAVDALVVALIALTLHHQDNIGIIGLSVPMLISDRLKISLFSLNSLLGNLVNA